MDNRSSFCITAIQAYKPHPKSPEPQKNNKRLGFETPLILVSYLTKFTADDRRF